MSTGLDENQLDRPQSAPRPPSAQPEVQATLDLGVRGRILHANLNMAQSITIYPVSSWIVSACFSFYDLVLICYHSFFQV